MEDLGQKRVWVAVEAGASSDPVEAGAGKDGENWSGGWGWGELGLRRVEVWIGIRVGES